MEHPSETEDTTERPLIRLFGSTSRARILMLFFDQPEQKRFQREVVFETGLSLQTVQRELANLVELEILKRESSKSRVYYSLNRQSPWFIPLDTIVRKKIPATRNR